jgi:O-antigen/teichoic acid export membrane protein
LSENLNLETPPPKGSAAVRFAGDILWISLSQLIVSLMGIFTLPALTKSYSPEIFGVWTQINVTVSLLTPILNLQLGSTIVRFLSGEEDEAKRRHIFGSMLLAVTVISLVVLACTYLLASQISQFLFHSAGYVLYVRLTFLWVFSNVLYSLFAFYLRSRKKIKLLAVRQIVVSLLTLAAIVILSGRGYDLEWIIISVIAIQVIFLVVFFVTITRDTGFPYPNISGINRYLAFSLPLIPNGLLMWIINSSDRYFVTGFIGLTKTGVYSSSNNIGGLISLFYFPIGFVLLPVISSAWEQNRMEDVKKYFEYSVKLFLTLAVPAAAGLTILSQPLLRSLTTSEYMIGWQLVLLIAIGTIFMGIYSINANVILLQKKTRWWPLIISSAALTSILINVTLIPRIGLMGAAVSNIVSYFLLALIASIWAARVVRYRFDLIYLVKIIAATLIMVFCLFFVKINTTYMLFVAVGMGVVVFALFVFLFRAFSEQDKHYLRIILSGLSPKKK